jgi:hypothetical protein
MLESSFIAFAIIFAIILVLGGLFSRFGRKWNEL